MGYEQIMLFEWIIQYSKKLNTQMPQEGLSNTMTIVAMANGMIGGIILVMPILALKTGTALIAPTSLITGFFSYFSCLLCLRHLRNYKDLDQAVYMHFGKKRSYRVFYDSTIVISISVLLILYFDLICKQWEGMTSQSPLIPILNALVLFPIVYVMKKFHFGASLLAYGILSIIGYVIFLIWMWATAPEGPNEVEVADSHFTELGAALAQGYAIQTFFVPILKQNPKRNLYKRLLIITYAIGIGVYTFIGYSGAFSLINRKYPGQDDPTTKPPQTIEQYFEGKQWEVIVVQIIYLVHLYSAFPEFLLIAKKRFFGILKWPQTSDVTFKEVMYVGVSIFVCLVIRLTSLSAEVLIQLNGSIISFIFVYVIPIGLHVKCVYMTKQHERHHRWEDEQEAPKQVEREGEQLDDYQEPSKSKESQGEVPEIKGQKSENPNEQRQIEMIPQPKKQSQNELKPTKTKSELAEQNQIQSSKSTDHPSRGPKYPSNNTEGDEECMCDIEFKSKLHEYCEMGLMVMMLALGISTMVLTVFFVAEEEAEAEKADLSRSLL